MQVQPHSPPELLASYAARPDRYDELCQRIGSVVVVRPHWRDFFHGLAAMPADELSARRAALGRQIHENGITYNRFINGLKNAGVEVDRKIMAELAVSDPQAFTALVEIAKANQAVPA